MITTGELINEEILVEKQKDIGRLHGKSNFGEPTGKNKLKLDIIEGVFLLGEEKIKIFKNNKEIKFQDIVKIAAKKIPNFEIKYLVFKDLRNRGYAIKLHDEKDNIAFNINQKTEGSYFVSVFSERDFLKLKETKEIINYASKKGNILWFAILDEEGDITYYEVTQIDIKGKTKVHKFSKSKGILLKDRVIIFNEKLTKNLFEKEFFGKFFGDGLQLSFIEALYLLEKKIIDVFSIDEKKISKDKFLKIIQKLQPDIDLRIIVFKDLKKRGLIVKTGFKFGTHFRAYTKSPNETHAEYLIHVVKKDFKSIWSEISRAVRLAHSVNKEIIFARVDKKIDYIKFGRLRP